MVIGLDDSSRDSDKILCQSSLHLTPDEQIHADAKVVCMSIANDKNMLIRHDSSDPLTSVGFAVKQQWKRMGVMIVCHNMQRVHIEGHADNSSSNRTHWHHVECYLSTNNLSNRAVNHSQSSA
jgi:hypothetical protein